MDNGYVEVDNFIQVTRDKFTFKVDKECYYHPSEFWVREEEGIIAVGITDFLQIHAGDIAFVELPEAGQKAEAGDEIGTIETIKQNIAIVAPISGSIVEVNSVLEEEPELINNDAYGEGWIFKIAPSDWEADKPNFMTAREYLPLMEEKIRAELDKDR
ncbi:MAG: glycine cleavage system protein GcvH [Syntrophomonadaceae bacterium]|nr:glycine cleavage system protein GcvH [Syntrophomonadaceae bacterium]